MCSVLQVGMCEIYDDITEGVGIHVVLGFSCKGHHDVGFVNSMFIIIIIIIISFLLFRVGSNTFYQVQIQIYWNQLLVPFG